MLLVSTVLGGGVSTATPCVAQTTPTAEARYAEARSVQDVVTRTAGESTRLFALLDVPDGTGGFLIRLPRGAELADADVLQYGARRQPTTITRRGDTHVVQVKGELRGLHDVVVRVTFPRAGRVQWSIQPFAAVEREGQETAAEPTARFSLADLRPSGRRFEQQIVVERERLSSQGANLALAFRGEPTGPIILDAREIPPFERSVSFTAEFWLATTGLDEVILSTWTGEEDRNYPLELVVDVAGRVRFFCGQPGRHTSMSSKRPLANGQWHHVALTYDGDARALRLMVDGVAVDSVNQVSLPGGYLRPDLAIGGRLPAQDQRDRTRFFSGEIDVLRLWNVARTPSEIQQTMRQTELRQETEAATSGWTRDEERVITLTFDDVPPSGMIREWPREARRQPSSLRLRHALHNLHASTRGGQVHLRWHSDAAGVDAFVVERSAGNGRFEEVQRLTPEDAERTPEPGERLFKATDEPAAQVVFYRIRELYRGGGNRVSGTFKVGVGPTETEPASRIAGNYPNPFSNKTTIEFELDEPSPVRLTLWDVSGKRLGVILDQSMSAGPHSHTFSARDLPSGTYFIRLETGSTADSHRIVVLR